MAKRVTGSQAIQPAQSPGRWQQLNSIMRIESLLLLLTLFGSCHSQKETSSFIPLDYTFPDDKIKSGKTFTYVDQSSGGKDYHDYYFGDNNGKKCLIVKAYSFDGTSDSLIYINHKLVESYAYFFIRYEPTKADILQDTILQNGTRLGKSILTVKFESDSTILTIRSESEFLKDTAFNWKGTLLPTIVINTTYNSSVHYKSRNREGQDFKIEFMTYEAQKTGTVRTRVLTTKENVPKNIDLVDIRDRQM